MYRRGSSPARGELHRRAGWLRAGWPTRGASRPSPCPPRGELQRRAGWLRAGSPGAALQRFSDWLRAGGLSRGGPRSGAPTAVLGREAAAHPAPALRPPLTPFVTAPFVHEDWRREVASGRELKAAALGGTLGVGAGTRCAGPSEGRGRCLEACDGIASRRGGELGGGTRCAGTARCLEASGDVADETAEVSDEVADVAEEAADVVEEAADTVEEASNVLAEEAAGIVEEVTEAAEVVEIVESC